MLVEIKRFGKEERATCTSLDVAETFEKNHRDVLRSVRDLDCSADFRLRNFAQSVYNNEQNHEQPMYVMTRDGFVFLVMGFSGERAAKFKEAYINQFNAMENELKGRLVEREKGIAVRQALTKALQQSTENDRMHGHAYSTYTNCIYKTLFGKNAAQLREMYGLDRKGNPRDCLNTEELHAVQAMERLVSGLVDCGWEYDRVRDFISQNNMRRLTG